jgi:quinol monooxygenase YgiN
MQFKNILILICSVSLLAVASPVIAQDEETNDGLARMVHIRAKAGHSQDLEKAITEYHHYMGDKEGAWRYQWYSILTGPNSGDYLARSGGHNWADFDADFDWQDEAGAKFRAEVAPYIEDADVMLTRTDQERGIWPDDISGYEYYTVTEWHIMPGHGSDFSEGLTKIDGALKEGGWPNYYSFFYTVSGGHGNTITLVSPRKNYADMAPKEPEFMDVMKEAMGEEEAEKFLDGWYKTFKRGDYYMVAYRPELSNYGTD